jgi:lipopolysaccharide/colanic/teichoic acid biosynthesis glycosyltransferase
MSPFSRAVKRIFDIVAGAAGLILVGPVLLAIAVVVKLGSPGPVFYRGVRTGLHGESFRIFKFRTMIVDAESAGGTTTALNDTRITGIGGFLRAKKLDELPQLLNVLSARARKSMNMRTLTARKSGES